MTPEHWFWIAVLIVSGTGAVAGISSWRHPKPVRSEDAFWPTILRTIAANPISFFAVFCVSCTAAFLGYLSERQLDVLESPKWCGNAINADKITPGKEFKGLESCLELLKMQISSISTGFHIGLLAYALTLIVLIVVVVAGARLALKVSQQGVDMNVSKHDAEKAAEHVREGAEEAEREVKQELNKE